MRSVGGQCSQPPCKGGLKMVRPTFTNNTCGGGYKNCGSGYYCAGTDTTKCVGCTCKKDRDGPGFYCDAKPMQRLKKFDATATPNCTAAAKSCYFYYLCNEARDDGEMVPYTHCGQIDAAPAMPLAMFDPANADKLALYVLLVQQLLLLLLMMCTIADAHTDADVVVVVAAVVLIAFGAPAALLLAPLLRRYIAFTASVQPQDPIFPNSSSSSSAAAPARASSTSTPTSPGAGLPGPATRTG